MKKTVTIFLLMAAFILAACQDGRVPATESSNYADQLRAELAGQITPTPVQSQTQPPTPISAQPQIEQPVSLYSGQCDLFSFYSCGVLEIAPLILSLAGVWFAVVMYPRIAVAAANGKAK